MNKQSPLQQRPAQLKLWLRIVSAILLLLLLIICSGWWYLRGSLPQIDGIAHVKELSAPVEIVRDANAIPHIFAKTSNDAYLALGYAHAQDRLWQLEMNRRIGSGRLSEIFGAQTLDQDKFLRTLGIRRTANAIYRDLDNATRERLKAYAAGVNSFLQNRTGALPVEFLILGVKPEPWTPEDSIAWQLMMAWDLSGNWLQEVLRLRLSQKLTNAQIEEFLPPYPGDRPLHFPNLTQLYAGLDVRLDHLAAIAPAPLPEGAGSNNWVVNGQRTQSGKPLLANDPHLGLSAPAIWYFAHLDAPDLKTIGATLPGLPAIVLGRNDRIAWGFTNTAPDTQDLFIEKIDATDPNKYLTPEGSSSFQIIEERIKVKKAEDVVLKVRVSRHGPIISDVAKNTSGLLPKNYALAFAWSALREDDRTITSSDKMARARDWKEFVEAVRTFHAPQQNIVYGDVEGNIGFIAPGRVPIRKPENNLHGLAPAPGWDARYDWTGFIPFDALPRLFNPASGKIVTANHKIVEDTYPYFLTAEWVPPYRADRIDTLIDATAKHSINSFRSIQADTLSLPATKFLPFIKSVQMGDQEGRRLQTLLAAWDGKMSTDRPEPLVFHTWLREFTRLVYQDELGELFGNAWDQRAVFMLDVLNNKNGESRWCDNIQTPQQETCNEQISTALINTNRYLTEQFGGDIARWHWGAAHIARSAHRPFSGKPIIGALFDITIPSPGDTYSINVGRNSIRDEVEPFTSRHAASLRAIYDLSDLDHSVFIHSTGQSGNRLSPFYANFAERWVKADYVPMTTKRSDIENNKIGTLVLSN